MVIGSNQVVAQSSRRRTKNKRNLASQDTASSPDHPLIQQTEREKYEISDRQFFVRNSPVTAHSLEPPPWRVSHETIRLFL